MGPNPLDFQTNDDGQHVDAMSPILFDERAITLMVKRMNKWNPNSRKEFHSDSLCQQLSIRSVPIKIRNDQLESGHVAVQNYNSRAVSLDTFVPGGITNWNVGSNYGMALLLKRELIKVLDANGQHAPKKYRMIVADVNIFERLIKVNTFTLHQMWS